MMFQIFLPALAKWNEQIGRIRDDDIHQLNQSFLFYPVQASQITALERDEISPNFRRGALSARENQRADHGKFERCSHAVFVRIIMCPRGEVRQLAKVEPGCCLWLFAVVIS
jgi:hypothetical protein